MKSSVIALIIAAIIAISAFTFSFVTPFVTVSYNDSENPLLIVYNRDDNMTHSVWLSIANTSEMHIFESTYILNPGENVIPDIYRPQINEDYIFKIIVDSEIKTEKILNISPTRMVVIDIKPSYDNEGVTYSIIDLTASGYYTYFWEEP